MGDKSAIGWTDASWNPVTGCTKVSPGCKFCYAKHQAWPRLAANPKTRYFGREFENVRCHPEMLDQPIRWRRPRRIFVNSMSDLFHEDIPDHFIDQIFAVMALCPRHQFQVLTKRPERMREYMLERWQPGREMRVLDLVVPAETVGETRVDQVYSACQEFTDRFNLCDPSNPSHWTKDERHRHVDERRARPTAVSGDASGRPPRRG